MPETGSDLQQQIWNNKVGWRLSAFMSQSWNGPNWAADETRHISIRFNPEQNLSCQTPVLSPSFSSLPSPLHFSFYFILVLLPSAGSGVKSSSLPDLGESNKFTSSPTNNGTKKGNKAVIPLFVVLYSFSSRGTEDQISKYEGQEKTLAQINAIELFCSSHPGDRGTVKMIFSTKGKISKDISSPYRYFLQWKGIMNDIKLKDLTLYNWYVLVFLIIKD